MDATPEKYLKLFWALFFSFLAFILALILLMYGLRFFFGLFDKIPGVTYAFTLFIISVPAALFISVFLIYWKRTKTHPSAGARIASYILFIAALGAWGYTYVKDLILFFRKFYTAIGFYDSYSMFLLGGSVLCLVAVGMIQALSEKKRPDWMEKHNRVES